MVKLLENVAGNINFKAKKKKGNEGDYLLKWKINHHQMGKNIRVFRVFRPFSA
jgi:hypothetical protein